MIIKNYIYNLMYQIMTLILPIITVPYISRVLGPDGIGKYSLTATYAQYFTLIGMVGLTMYCSREVAYVRDDYKKLSETFWQLNFLRFFTMGLSIIVYIIIFIYIIDSGEKILNIIQILILLSSLIDISWLFIGLENFKKISIRNATVKIIGVLLIFILIKDKSQVWLYALILGGTQFVGQAIMWFDLPRGITFISPNFKLILRHLKFSLKLFIPQIAINVYTMFDKIMLGLLSTELQVGLYDNSQKIIKILIAIITTISVVTMPTMSNIYKNNKINEFCQNAKKSFVFVSFLAFPMAFGLIAISENFIPWFYGKGFEGIKPMFIIGSGLMISLAWSSIVGSQILISIKREKEFTIAVTSGAIINIIFNFILIRKFEGVGTTISSVIAEFIGTFIMMYYVRDLINIKELIRPILKYFIGSFIMFLIVLKLGDYIHSNIIGTITQTIVGIIVYSSIMILRKDKNIEFILNLIKNKINSII